MLIIKVIPFKIVYYPDMAAYPLVSVNRHIIGAIVKGLVFTLRPNLKSPQ